MVSLNVGLEDELVEAVVHDLKSEAKQKTWKERQIKQSIASQKGKDIAWG